MALGRLMTILTLLITEEATKSLDEYNMRNILLGGTSFFRASLCGSQCGICILEDMFVSFCYLVSLPAQMFIYTHTHILSFRSTA